MACNCASAKLIMVLGAFLECHPEWMESGLEKGGSAGIDDEEIMISMINGE